MDESKLSSNTDNSLMSRETESNSIISNSFESQSPISQDLKNHIINSIVANLKDIIEENKQNGRNKYTFKDNLFYLEQVPNITLEKYIRHIVRYTKMNISTLILSVIYIDQFCDKYRYVITLNNIYRLILIAIYISLKYNEDIPINTRAYATIVGVSPEDLKNLEYQMCMALEFSFFVKDEYYQQYFVYFSNFSA